MTKWLASVVMIAAVASCYGSGGDDDEGGGECLPPGSPASFCDVVVGDIDECPAVEDMCTPDSCGSFDCCYCDSRGFPATLITDCFEGCSGNVDAATSP